MPTSTKQQRGVVLVTGLIFLVILTLLGTTALQGTVLEEKMAGNLRDETLALQAAEAAYVQAKFFWSRSRFQYLQVQMGFITMPVTPRLRQIPKTGVAGNPLGLRRAAAWMASPASHATLLSNWRVFRSKATKEARSNPEHPPMTRCFALLHAAWEGRQAQS